MNSLSDNSKISSAFCRHCGTELKDVFCDLINSPPSNSLLEENQLNEPEPFYPLKIFVCHRCHLVQINEMKKAADIFNETYTYFSSYSTSWLAHSKRYVDMMMERFQFDHHSLVMEIASNDGYLLQYFREKAIPVLGIEPAANTAAVAESKGIETITSFFGHDFAKQELIPNHQKPDLIIGNNVLAHVPDINDFVRGMKITLKDSGLITMEFPHLLRLVEEVQFDTIYHEHFSYFSLTTVKNIFNHFGLEIFDVEEIPTHGGSLRIFARHAQNTSLAISKRTEELLEKEAVQGLKTPEYYQGFQNKVDHLKYGFWRFLLEAKSKKKKIIGYGAAAKGNTFLNYAGVRGNDIISFVVDASPHKQNKYLPGSHIPIVGLEEIARFKPDYVIILPWNLKEEISSQLSYINDWNGQFVTFIPQTEIFNGTNHHRNNKQQRQVREGNI